MHQKSTFWAQKLKIFWGGSTAPPPPRPSPLGRGHPLPISYPLRRLQRLDPRAYGASPPNSNRNRRHCMNPNTSVTKIGWNSLHCFLRYGVHGVFGSLSAVTLTFDLLTLKSNQHIYEPIYTYDQNWAKVPSLVFEIWCSHSLTHGQTDPNTVCFRRRF